MSSPSPIQVHVSRRGSVNVVVRQRPQTNVEQQTQQPFVDDDDDASTSSVELQRVEDRIDVDAKDDISAVLPDPDERPIHGESYQAEQARIKRDHPAEKMWFDMAASAAPAITTVTETETETETETQNDTAEHETEVAVAEVLKRAEAMRRKAEAKAFSERVRQRNNHHHHAETTSCVEIVATEAEAEVEDVAAKEPAGAGQRRASVMRRKANAEVFSKRVRQRNNHHAQHQHDAAPASVDPDERPIHGESYQAEQARIKRDHPAEKMWFDMRTGTDDDEQDENNNGVDQEQVGDAANEMQPDADVADDLKAWTRKVEAMKGRVKARAYADAVRQRANVALRRLHSDTNGCRKEVAKCITSNNNKDRRLFEVTRVRVWA